MDKMVTVNFGEHITIDGYEGSEEKLSDKNLILFCLSDLVAKLGMRELAPPQVYFAEGNDDKDPGGWTGFVIIEESHISIHTFPKRLFVSADVYTCKNGLNQELILEYFKEKFLLKDVELNFLKRGTRYPANNLV